MTIAATSVKPENLIAISPNGTEYKIDSVTFDSASGQAVYKLAKTWVYADNGTWKIKTSKLNPVLDNDGNPVAETQLGTFQVNIAVPTNTTAPTVTLVSIAPSSITVAGSQDVTVTVTYADPA